MIVLPIVQRELGAAARRRLTYWLRTVFALLAEVIGVVIYLANHAAPTYEIAQTLFQTLKWLAFSYCLVYGIRSTADCLSAEKREGTLGLLFLTDLKGYDVVLGKLAASSLAGFYGLLATFPILALPLLFGGVTASQFWRVLLVLVSTFQFSLAMGMFVSAVSRHARRAMLGTLVWLLLFTASLPACSALLRELVPTFDWLGNLLRLASPVYSLLQADDGQTGSTLPYFWPSITCLVGLALVFLTLASSILPTAWQDRPADARRWRARWQTWLNGNSKQRALLRVHWLERNPITWLAARSRFASASVWSVLALCLVLWELGCLMSGSAWYNEGNYFSTALVLNSLLKLWLASAAARRLAADRHSGAIELVLSTPLSVQRILHGQLSALGRQFLGPVLAVLGLHLIFLAASLQRESFADNPINPTLWVAAMIILVADLITLGWVAMWGAMTFKNPNRVTTITLVRVLALPWVLVIALQLVGGPMFPWDVNVEVWFGASLLVDLGFSFAAWWQLRSGFRQFACSRFVPLPSPFSLASLRRHFA